MQCWEGLLWRSRIFPKSDWAQWAIHISQESQANSPLDHFGIRQKGVWPKTRESRQCKLKYLWGHPGNINVCTVRQRGWEVVGSVVNQRMYTPPKDIWVQSFLKKHCVWPNKTYLAWWLHWKTSYLWLLLRRKGLGHESVTGRHPVSTPSNSLLKFRKHCCSLGSPSFPSLLLPNFPAPR